MKLSPFLLFSCAAFFACLAIASANEKSSQPTIELETLIVRTTNEVMRQALNTPTNEKILTGNAMISPEAFQQIQAFFKKSNADFLGAPRVVTNSGQRASVESVRELRYPTEYEKNPNEPGQFTPKSFETRNVGVTVELEAKVLADGQIDLNLAPTITSFLGFIDYSTSKTPADGEAATLATLLKGELRAGNIWQPIFATEKINTSILLVSGQTILLGSIPTTQVDVPEISQEKKQEKLPNAASASPKHVFIFVSARILGQ